MTKFLKVSFYDRYAGHNVEVFYNLDHIVAFKNVFREADGKVELELFLTNEEEVKCQVAKEDFDVLVKMAIGGGDND